MNSVKHNHSDQRGVTAILTVVFFTILMSVVTLSFLRIAVLEQTQTLQDQQSKNAYDAAQSGVEDAKRAILYCQANPGAGICSDLTDTTCPGFFGDGSGKVRSPGLVTQLGLTQTTDPDNNSIQVGDPALNERYTCTIIATDTKDILGSLNPKNLAKAPSSDFIPLKATKSFNTIVVYWDKLASGTITLPSQNRFSNGSNYKDVADPANEWQSSWPSLMRLDVLQNKDTGGFQNDKEDSSGTQTQSYFVYPVQNGTKAPIDAFNDTDARKYNVADCRTGGVSDIATGAKWGCAVTLKVNPSFFQYLSLQAYYSTTKYAVELFNGNVGAPNLVKFNNVRPTIDSTGAANNVLRRVLATVQMGVSGNSLQPVALDVNNRLCKNFFVTNDPSDFNESCTTN